MDVKIRKGKQDWCFVEDFNVYNYCNKGTISVTVGITVDGRLATPYVYRGEDFIPLSVIEEEMGISKYVKAKKPFYCKLSDGFIACIKAGIDFKTGEFIPDTSTYTLYENMGLDLETATKGVLHLRRIIDLPDNVRELMEKVSKEVIKCKGDREEYLRERL